MDPYNSYHRLYAIVPIVGTGSSADPSRPLYAPTVDEINAKSGILAFTSELGDDGKHALIEIVARNRSAFTKILADPSVAAFEKGSAGSGQIESAFSKYKASFHLSQFEEVPVR